MVCRPSGSLGRLHSFGAAVFHLLEHGAENPPQADWASSSGADAANLTVGGPGQYGKPSQADQLASVARKYAVKQIFVTVGANDDPNFGKTAEDCVYAFVFQTGYGCAQIDGPSWSSRVANMVPKAENAVKSIKTVMANAHYKPGSYKITVVSYGGPTPEPPLRYSGYWAKVFNGCPIYDSDSAWGHDTATPALDKGERQVAADENVRFLDMVHGFFGHEVCAAGISHDQEWVRGVTYDPGTNWWNLHSVQQSFHPNARGHAQIASCVNGFVSATYREGTCELGTDGSLHSEPHP